MTEHKRIKPLGGKAYGSIAHLPNSRMGPADHAITEGQASICTVKCRKGDRIIVTEKLDGGCVSVAKIDGSPIALTRSGHRACESTYPHHLLFHEYVAMHETRFKALLEDGERVCAEWLAMAHGTRYDMVHRDFNPFVPFDIMRGKQRISYDEFRYRMRPSGFESAWCVHDDACALSIDEALNRLGPRGFHAAIDPVEGAVWRCETNGEFNFMAKYVRPDKVDGTYLESISGQPPLWNWHSDDKLISHERLVA